MSTQSLTNEIGGERRERDEGRKEGRLTVPCNEERVQRGPEKGFVGPRPQRGRRMEQEVCYS